MAEYTVTYPNAAVVYDPVQRSIAMVVVPGVGETARFVVLPGLTYNILPSNDPFLQKQFLSYVTG
jgi:hypothetical protein